MQAIDLLADASMKATVLHFRDRGHQVKESMTAAPLKPGQREEMTDKALVVISGDRVITFVCEGLFGVHKRHYKRPSPASQARLRLVMEKMESSKRAKYHFFQEDQVNSWMLNR